MAGGGGVMFQVDKETSSIPHVRNCMHPQVLTSAPGITSGLTIIFLEVSTIHILIIYENLISNKSQFCLRLYITATDIADRLKQEMILSTDTELNENKLEKFCMGSGEASPAPAFVVSSGRTRVQARFSQVYSYHARIAFVG